MRIHLLERSQRVEVPIDRAFAFYGDSRNLEPMTPPWLHFHVTNAGPVTMEPGALLHYRLQAARRPDPLDDADRDLGAADPLRRLPAERPYALWEHTHIFEADGAGATIIRDRVRYAIPFGPLATLAHRLFVRRDLERIFDYRAEAFARLAEGGSP